MSMSRKKQDKNLRSRLAGPLLEDTKLTHLKTAASRTWDKLLLTGRIVAIFSLKELPCVWQELFSSACSANPNASLLPLNPCLQTQTSPCTQVGSWVEQRGNYGGAGGGGGGGTGEIWGRWGICLMTDGPQSGMRAPPLSRGAVWRHNMTHDVSCVPGAATVRDALIEGARDVCVSQHAHSKGCSSPVHTVHSVYASVWKGTLCRMSIISRLLRNSLSLIFRIKRRIIHVKTDGGDKYSYIPGMEI